MDLKKYIEEKRDTVNKALHSYCSEPDGLATDVIESMNYSLFAGGKRLRPILCIAGAEAVNGGGADVLPVACALELIHTYSLIHDDLPVMDDDDLRRGRPTNHKVFGEAIALLAGDGLLTEAFHLMTAEGETGIAEPAALIRVVNLIASAAGFRGMVGGQAVDIQSEGKVVSPSHVEYIHVHKTGALIAASVTSGAILGGAGNDDLNLIRTYGEKIGLAFQVADDILDVEGDSEEMGKTVGADEQKNKNTYPSIYGLERSKEIQKMLIREAVSSLNKFGSKAEPLRSIAQYIIERRK